MKPIKRITHSNATEFKWENSRVCVGTWINGDYVIQFRLLTNDLSRRALHHVRKGKVVVTSLNISKEAAVSLMTGLRDMLEKEGELK